MTGQEGDQVFMDYRSQTEDESCFGMEADTGSVAHSTLALAQATNQHFLSPGL